MAERQSARAPWTDVVLVCEKCARKAGRKGFAKELKTALKRSGRKKTVRVVEVGCLDLCPKRRLTVATLGDLANRRLSVLPADANADRLARDFESKSSGGPDVPPPLTAKLTALIDSHEPRP